MLKKTGKKGEDIAVSFLQQKKYKILDQNFCIRGGEIDIIAEKDEQIVFVEVKTRKNKKFGEIIEQISKNKQNFLINSANNYLFQKELTEKNWRIDVITVFLSDQEPKIEHIKNAITYL